MNDDACKLLFTVLSQILKNQQKIMRHLGITKNDSEYGWNDEDMSNTITECDIMSEQYNHDK